MKPVVTWIVIADGTQARVFENAGPGKGLAPVDGLRLEEEALKTSEIVTDRQGRSYSSVGHGRSAIEPRTDPAEYRETEFARRVAALLDEKHAEHAFKRLIIAAAPTTLGDLRKALSAATRSAIMAEMPKDLTNMPRQQLDKQFGDLLAL
ncbi:host attachment protein [Paradevosia shaoguanensis]|uniref:Host attachment protein n=1 Tax=Paradevosia shaoguanensis TaxID=1335043 RepID=A0AA41UC49_9HYPH|nr:host attachment protein [Paradevosia shaoguanensis]MCF1743374.1 host attachment protein [Paradevosia shaoguanensis]MCI0127857.1 host attachment protein [Paradevosia shaoguanensis]